MNYQTFTWRPLALLAGSFMILMLVFNPSAIINAQQPAPSVEIRDGVRQAAEAQGQVRVIINLRTPNVQFEAAPDTQITQTVAAAQVRVLQSLAPDWDRNTEFQAATFDLLHQYAFVPALAGSITPAGLDQLANHPDVASIQLDDQGRAGMAEARQIIGAKAVTDTYGYTGNGVTIAMLDSGIDTDHPYLSDDISTFRICFTNGDCVPNNANTSTNAEDETGHGTAVAGVVTSRSTAHQGIADNTIIVPVRVLNDQNIGFVADWVAGLDWIRVNQGGLGVDIVNMSIQTDATFGGNCDATYPSLSNAINQLYNQGVTVIAITGNGAQTNAIAAPGCHSNVITVGATYDFNGTFNVGGSTCVDNNAVVDKVACFSNSSPMLDLLAPGAIISAPLFNSSADGPRSGTSMAGPMVAGTVALMLEAYPTLTPAQIEAILKATGKEVTDARNGRVTPRVDALGSVNLLIGINPIQPTGNIFDGDPLFEWSDVAATQTFRLEVVNLTRTITAFNSNVSREGICNGSTCRTRLGLNLLDGNHQWRVQTVVGGVNGVWSDWQTFTAIGPVPGAPNGNLSNDLQPTYNWTHLQDATWYRLYVDGTATGYFDQWFSADEICSSNLCAVQPTDFGAFLGEGSHTWYVRPWLGSFNGVWGGPQTFNLTVSGTTATPATQPVTDTNTLNPTFIWDGTGNALWFEIRIRNGGGDLIVSEWVQRDIACGTLAGTDCSARLNTALENNASFVFDMRGWGSAGLSNYSATRAFNINALPPTTPAGLNVVPERGDSTFLWNNDDNALWFHLIISDADDNTELLNQWYQKDEDARLYCTEVTCGVIPKIYLANGTYNWRVESWGNTGLSPSFGQAPALVINEPVAQPPALNTMGTENLEVHTEGDRFRYFWPDITGASWYEFALVNESDQILLNEWSRRLGICVEGECAINPETYLENGDYTWYVRAWGPAGIGEWGSGATFTVDGAGQNSAPSLLTATPAGTINTGTPDFTWDARSGATWYQLEIKTGGGTLIFENWLYSEALACPDGIGTCTATPAMLDDLLVQNGAYTYRLRIWGPGGLSPWSSIKAFTVNAATSGTVDTLVTPAPEAAFVGTSSVDFEWAPTTDTAWYRVRLTRLRNDETTQQDYWFPVTDLSCADDLTNCTVTIDDLGYGGYTWNIATWGPGTPGSNFPTSASQSFVILE